MTSLAEVRARVETDLDDATLQTIIDAESEAIERLAGTDSETETQFASGLPVIVLQRLPAEITRITERRCVTSEAVELQSDDWRMSGRYGIRRLHSGTNAAGTWGEEVVIEYVPSIDYRLRDRVLLDLVQMSVEFRAFETEEVGDTKRSETQGAYERRRHSLLKQLKENRGLIA